MVKKAQKPEKQCFFEKKAEKGRKMTHSSRKKVGKSTKNDHFSEIDQKRHETGQKPGVSWDLMKKGQKTTKNPILAPPSPPKSPKNVKFTYLGCHHEKKVDFRENCRKNDLKNQKMYRVVAKTSNPTKESFLFQNKPQKAITIMNRTQLYKPNPY